MTRRSLLLLTHPSLSCKPILSDTGWESQRAAFCCGFQMQVPAKTRKENEREAHPIQRGRLQLTPSPFLTHRGFIDVNEPREGPRLHSEAIAKLELEPLSPFLIPGSYSPLHGASHNQLGTTGKARTMMVTSFISQLSHLCHFLPAKQ